MEEKLTIKDTISLMLKGIKKEDVIEYMGFVNNAFNEVEDKVEQTQAEPDYKSLYEESQRKLKEAQIDNVNANYENPKVEEVDLSKLFANKQ